MEIRYEWYQSLRLRLRWRCAVNQYESIVGTVMSYLSQVIVGHIQELSAIISGVAWRQLHFLLGELAFTAATVRLIRPGQTNAVAETFPPCA